MLLPIFLSMDHHDMAGEHAALSQLVTDHTAPALLVAAAHTLAMVSAGALLAVLVYRWFGLRAVSRTWFNLGGYLASRRPHIGCGSLPRRQAGATYNKAQLAAKDAPSRVAMGIRADRGR
ncbi:MAG: hypothetical protein WKF73_05330 [Nocardioidaceae bacterium]